MLEELSNANARRPREDLHGSSGNIGAKDQEDSAPLLPDEGLNCEGIQLIKLPCVAELSGYRTEGGGSQSPTPWEVVLMTCSTGMKWKPGGSTNTPQELRCRPNYDAKSNPNITAITAYHGPFQRGASLMSLPN
nr:hypothetical protein CPAG_09665 [Coccidioides posadasii RMSCC 3488]